MFDFPSCQSDESKEIYEFPSDQDFLDSVSNLFNRVMFHKIDPMTKFRQLKKAHKKYFKIVSTPEPCPLGFCFAIHSGPDSPWEDMTTFGICSAYSEQMALLACLRSISGHLPLVYEGEWLGIDSGVRDGLHTALGVSPQS